MANAENVSNRLKNLDDIERKIIGALKNAGLTLEELSKDKPLEKNLDKHTGQFMQSMDEIETELATQITYLSQVAASQQHEGSSYAAQKKVQLLNEALLRMSTRVDDMVATAGEIIQPRNPQK